MAEQKIPIFVISLPQASKRREFISRQMREHGLAFSFFDAVDGERLSPEFLAKFKVAEGEQLLRRRLAKGELGCIFSHYKLLRQIEAAGLPQAIVLEDDVDLNERFADLVRQLQPAADNADTGARSSPGSRRRATDAPAGHDSISAGKWEMLQFGYWPRAEEGQPLIWRDLYPLSLWRSKQIILAGKKHYLGPLIDYIEGTHGYVISDTGAVKLRTIIEQYEILPFDDHLNYHNDLVIRYAVSPPLIQQSYTQGLEQHIEHDRAKIKNAAAESRAAASGMVEAIALEGSGAESAKSATGAEVPAERGAAIGMSGSAGGNDTGIAVANRTKAKPGPTGRARLGAFIRKIPLIGPIWAAASNARRNLGKTRRIMFHRPNRRLK